MTNLETAILSILREAADTGACAITHTDIHVQLVRRRWDVHDIMPQRIQDALIVLERLNLVRSEICWHAIPQPPPEKAPEVKKA